MRTWLGLLLGCEVICIAMLATGCGGDAAPPPPSAVTEGLPCDVHMRACQQAIYDAVSTIRDGRTRAAPPVQFISRDTLRDRLAGDPSMTGVPSSLSVGLQLIDLLDPSTRLDQAVAGEGGDTILAFYAPSEGAIYVVEDALGDVENTLFTVAHEMTHAVQDIDVDLRSFEAAESDSTDHVQTVHNLVEGEATHVAYVVTTQALYGNPRAVDWKGLYGAWADDTLDYIAAAASPYAAVSLLPYPVGARYLSDIWREDGFDAVRALYGGFPRATVRWLDGDPTTTDDAEPMDCAPPPAPAGFETVADDVFGSYLAFATAVAEGMPSSEAWSLAHAWRGDRLVIFDDTGSGTTAIAWRVRWASATDGAAFAALLDGAPPFGARQVRTEGAEVLVSASDDPLLLDTWPPADCVAPVTPFAAALRLPVPDLHP